MPDLIGGFERIRRVYRWYIESAFPLRSDVLTRERTELLDRVGTDGDAGVLVQPPMVEPAAVYERSAHNLREASLQLPKEYQDLQHLARELFPAEAKLYKHQFEALQAGIGGEDVVVTTGTGSGKTESFLLPLLADLARDSRLWPRNPVPDDPDARDRWLKDRRWWANKGERIGQWEHHPSRPYAMRAMILYPLNALVEDQLRRLRRTLESPTVHSWMNDYRKGNRILFGRYTGQTPVSGRRMRRNEQGELKPNATAIGRLRRRLRDIAEEHADVLEQADDQTISEAERKLLREEVRYYFQNLDGGEMWSRWDMQDTPPDVLITNYSMLNIMLMRTLESRLFETTRQWLLEDPARQTAKPTRRFFLIVDELHAYRGTPGTEVAYILRLLLDRLGLSIESKQLVILATSASISDDDPDSRKFLREFFGRDRFRIIAGRQELPSGSPRLLMNEHRDAFAKFAGRVQPDVFEPPMTAPVPDDTKHQQAMADLAADLAYAGEEVGARPRLGDALLRLRADDALKDACAAHNEKKLGLRQVRPSPLPAIDGILFPDAVRTGAGPSEAMRGLLLALGMSLDPATKASPQPVRGHLFFHNLQNVWACCNPRCCGRATDDGAPTVPVGVLHPRHRLSCNHCNGRVLDLIVCEVCGEAFLGGYRRSPVQRGYPKGVTEILTADQPNLEDIPDRVKLGRQYQTYAVFWPIPETTPWTRKPASDGGERAQWQPVKLDVYSGEVIRSPKPPVANSEIPGYVYHIPGFHPDEDPMPGVCPCCNADYRRKKSYDTPLRNHRTGFQKACQVLATATVREMPSRRDGRPNRKLVIFSDSRQDAAKLAAGVERDHFRDMVRLSLLSALRDYWVQFLAGVKRAAGARPTAGPSPDAVDRLRELSAALADAISPGVMSGDEQRLANEWEASNDKLFTELRRRLEGEEPKDLGWWERANALIDLHRRGFVPLPDLCRAVNDRLLRLGIPAGGTTYGRLWYYNQKKRHAWYEAFRWEEVRNNRRVDVNPPAPKPDLPDTYPQWQDRVISGLTGELMYAMFPHRARTLEGLGQGYVACLPTSAPTDPKVAGAILGVIRQMGVRRSYLNARYFYPGGTLDDLPGYVSEYLNEYLSLASTEDVRAALLSSRAGTPGYKHLGLDPDHLYVVRTPEREGDDGRPVRPGFECPRCKSFYLHDAGGKCPDCGGQMAPGVARAAFDYYVYLSARAGDPFRFRCEELTGQTPAADRPGRQRRFQEVYIGGEERRPQGIDLLSVTTTMEAGVDIGGLQAVMMANMPPRRFNYQQRVGRAGRRGAGLSLAVTFCRGRSHDDFYYQRTEKITGDPPPTPYVDLTSESILKRVAAKEILRLAFTDLCPDDDPEGAPDSVHGEFGTKSEWLQSGVDQRMRGWLADPDREEQILGVIDLLRVQTPWRDGEPDAGAFRTRMLAYLRDNLVNEITAVATDERYTHDALSERLANAGLLPMFGFPTRVRLLHTSWPESGYPWPPEYGTIDRDLDVAISQFAPGSETVRDKAVHTACGVFAPRPVGNIVKFDDGFAPPLTNANPYPLRFCSECQATVDGDAPFSPVGREQLPGPEVCPICKVQALFVVDAREPKGFFTTLKPDDYDGAFEWVPRATRPTISIAHLPDKTEPVGNAFASILPQKEIITVNTNGDQRGFEFQAARVVTNDAANGPTDVEGAYAALEEATDRVVPHGPRCCVSLLSRRRTDSLLVDIQKWPEGVYADPKTVTGRAAWYSLAFFLRVAAAEQLDADTLEFDAGFRTLPKDDRPAGQAFLCDKLENGAGYCTRLGGRAQFEKLLAECDPKTEDGIASKWLAIAHAHECDASCNLCLRDFYNLPYHGLLDWRLGLDMARLLAGGHAPTLDTPWDEATPNPWVRVVERVPEIIGRLGFDTSNPEQFGTLTGFVLPHRQASKVRVVILRHSLWTADHPVWDAARTAAQSKYAQAQIQSLDPFLAIRRPAEYA